MGYGYIIFVFLLLPTMIQPADNKIDQKKQQEVTCYDPLQDHIKCGADVANIIKQYLAPYGLLSYMSTAHKDLGENIIHAHMSPGEVAIATCGENLEDTKYNVLLHTTAKMEFYHRLLSCSKTLIQDCAWAPDASQLAMTYDGSWDIVPTLVKYDGMQQKLCSKSIQKSKSPWYALVGTESKLKQPSAALIQYGSKSDIGSDAHPTQLAFVNDLLIAIFCKDKNEVREHHLSGPHQQSCMNDISAVDFSDYYLLGTTTGRVQYLTSPNQKMQEFQAFKDRPITLLSGCNNSIAAAADKIIKVFASDSRKLMAKFEHESYYPPSIIKLAPDGSKLAYAAGKALYIMSCEAQKEINRHIFSEPISWLHYGQDNSIYVAYGGTLLKILP